MKWQDRIAIVVILVGTMTFLWQEAEGRIDRIMDRLDWYLQIDRRLDVMEYFVCQETGALCPDDQ